MITPLVRSRDRLDPDERCDASRFGVLDDCESLCAARAQKPRCCPHPLRCECGASSASKPSPNEQSHRSCCLGVLTTRRGAPAHLSRLSVVALGLCACHPELCCAAMAYAPLSNPATAMPSLRVLVLLRALRAAGSAIGSSARVSKSMALHRLLTQVTEKLSRLATGFRFMWHACARAAG